MHPNGKNGKMSQLPVLNPIDLMWSRDKMRVNVYISPEESKVTHLIFAWIQFCFFFASAGVYKEICSMFRRMNYLPCLCRSCMYVLAC